MPAIAIGGAREPSPLPLPTEPSRAPDGEHTSEPQLSPHKSNITWRPGSPSQDVPATGLRMRALTAHKQRIAICHYGEQNGDLMRNPERVLKYQIEDGKVKKFHPY